VGVLACLGLFALPIAAAEPHSTVYLPLVADSAFNLGSQHIDALDPLDGFFSLATIHRIELAVDELGIDSLRERPRSYVHASIAIDGRELSDVGLRLKGAAGSFIPIGGDRPPGSGDGNGKPGKSAFIVDFNRFEAGQDFLGLKKLTINNLVQDPSFIHEYVGYSLFRAGSVPASRVGYAMIAFNGEDKGLYALLETPDNDAFLEKWFSSDEGNLYEGQYGVDLRSETVPEYDQDNGRDDSKADLYMLVRDLDSLEPGDDPMEVLDRHFDMDEYLSFAATELYLGHWDGYAWSTNNYMIHHDIEADEWTFLPWGIDQTFVDPLGEYAGVMRHQGPTWSPGPGGRIHELCYQSDTCRARLHDKFAELLARVDDMELMRVADDARQLVEEQALDEARGFGDPALTVEAFSQVTRHISRRNEEIEAWLGCLVGSPVDNDHDGFDGCRVDCDDHDPAVFPGADETCNRRDDDCNGIIDDPDYCPKCVVESWRSADYSFCFIDRPWPEAREYCLDHGLDLASIHDIESAEFVSQMLLERLHMPEAWIGLNDRESEGAFVWTDGSRLDFDRWLPYSPRRDGEETDCVLNLPDGWVDLPCADPHAFVCRSPEPHEP
jgi:hypothetical protein